MRKIFTKKCNNCQSHKIVYDEHKGDLFCYNCGFVLDNIYEIIKISEYQNNKEKEKRNQIQDLLIDYLKYDITPPLEKQHHI